MKKYPDAEPTLGLALHWMPSAAQCREVSHACDLFFEKRGIPISQGNRITFGKGPGPDFIPRPSQKNPAPREQE